MGKGDGAGPRTLTGPEVWEEGCCGALRLRLESSKGRGGGSGSEEEGGGGRERKRDCVVRNWDP